MERKRLVDRIILPLANFKNLVENDKEKTTKLEKKKTKEKSKAKPEPDHTVKKSDERISSLIWQVRLKGFQSYSKKKLISLVFLTLLKGKI